MTPVVDINADVGEGGPDEVLASYLTSCSIACGGHAGDAASMAGALELGRRHDLLVGAHPSYPDREGFGRREWPFSGVDLSLSLASQLESFGLAALRAGVRITHVKTHGELYNRAWTDEAAAEQVARAALALSPEVALFCPPGSVQEAVANRVGVSVVREVFADRRYTDAGVLLTRSEPGAVIVDPADLPGQLAVLAALDFDTICIHSDNPSAPALAAALPGMIAGLGWEIAPYPLP
jgi:UPF0271 protein